MGLEQVLGVLKKGDLEAARALVEANPGLGMERTPDGATFAQFAVYFGQKEIGRLWADACPTIDLPTACTVDDVSRVRDLLANGSASSEPSDDGFLPLALSAAFGSGDVVRALLDAGAGPNAASVALGGVRPLDAAIFGQNLAALTLLLDAGADPNLAQAGGFRPLHGAAQHGDRAAAEALLRYGADRQAVTEEGKTAAAIAREGGHQDLADMLA